ncbi:MAG: hypothetical protein QGG50_05050 [Methanopyri archaeon]|jgi:hypothetical protein|nr:hypothetical protein [Methanopyri archaeon]
MYTNIQVYKYLPFLYNLIHKSVTGSFLTSRTHILLPENRIYEVKSNVRDLSIELEPLRVEKVGDKYVNVVGSEDC